MHLDRQAHQRLGERAKGLNGRDGHRYTRGSSRMAGECPDLVPHKRGSALGGFPTLSRMAGQLRGWVLGRMRVDSVLSGPLANRAAQAAASRWASRLSTMARDSANEGGSSDNPPAPTSAPPQSGHLATPSWRAMPQSTQMTRCRASYSASSAARDTPSRRWSGSACSCSPTACSRSFL
jgi:hypothetical protein